METSDYVCDYCSRSFTRKYNLITHIQNFHLNVTWFCEICKQTFGSPSGLQLHWSRGHNRYGQGFPECDLCGRIFTRKQNIMSHMISVHFQTLRTYSMCNICNKTFTTERNLRRHLNQIHNPDAKYPTCDYCNKVFKGKSSLVSHIQTLHNVSDSDVNQCYLCDKRFSNNRNLKRHIEILHGEREKFQCDLCPKVFMWHHSLRRHTQSRHSTDDCEQFTCGICDKSFFGKENLESHISVYHKQDEIEKNSSSSESFESIVYVCECCHRQLDSESMLRQHVKTEHSFQDFYNYCKKSLLKTMSIENEDRQKIVFYKCDLCRNVFASVYDLKDHLKSCHDVDYSLSTCNVCFKKFYCKEAMVEHKKLCLPPKNVNSCGYCDKLFTDISSLEFHRRIFHPQTQIADSNITSSVDDSEINESFKCNYCRRVYVNDRSLKHHIKLNHTDGHIVQCKLCNKIFNNNYYLASHIKMIHSNQKSSKCDFCEKEFRTKGGIRRHIEFTHMRKSRYKCIECESLFKEKRSLRKHVRAKHAHSAIFPQCHICQKRFESAKSCKVHLKLLHSVNMNTYPCHLCTVSFNSEKSLNIHLSTKHLAKDQIFKCEACNTVFNGQANFDQHNSNHNMCKKEKLLPRCIICAKDFSVQKTLKLHIKKFHSEFNVDELAAYGYIRRVFNVECEECLRNFTNEFYYKIYLKLKHLRDSIIFKCDQCSASYNSLEYSIQKYKLDHVEVYSSKLILSELCTTEMSDSSMNFNDVVESTTLDIKTEPKELTECDIKTEPMSP